MMSAAGTTKAVPEFHGRHFILRAITEPAVLAKWSNNLQELCEGQRLGIPATVASTNPRNHIAADVAARLNVGASAFTA